MAIIAVPTKGSIRMHYGDGDNPFNYTVTKLDAEANPGNLLDLAEGVSKLHSLVPMDLIYDCEFHLLSE